MASSESKSRTLLIVEDDPGITSQLRWCLEEYNLVFATNRSDAIAGLRRHEPPVVLQDLGLPPAAEGTDEGFATLRETLEIAPNTKVVVVTGNADTDNALKAIGAGAFDFCQKPVDVDVLRMLVARAFRIAELEQELERRKQTHTSSPFEGMLAADPAMLQVCRIVEKVAPANVNVLILGESGTGKELLAQAIHDLSPRKKERFQAINCAAIPEQLLEAELFGHERGAFTGAVKQTLGKVELADGGTLFLDEIGDMPMSLQSKLLRFLQNKVIERIGGRTEIPVDVRIVAATNQNLDLLITQQRFRQDLFFRLSEVTVNVPPLRDRRADIVALANLFLQRFAAVYGRSKRGFSSEAMAAIAAHPWPGNVRELENKVKSAVLLADDVWIGSADLGLKAVDGGERAPNLREVRAQADRQAVQRALGVANGSVSKAADLLGVSRPTLYDLMQKLGITVQE
jgi:two-component system NtrC family response regulator